MTIRASAGSKWSAPVRVSDISDAFRAGSQGLSACVSTTGTLRGIRVFYGAGGSIQQASWDFPEVKSQMWQKIPSFNGTDDNAGVTCQIFPISNGNSLLNVYARSDIGGLAHFYHELTQLNAANAMTRKPGRWKQMLLLLNLSGRGSITDIRRQSMNQLCMQTRMIGYVTAQLSRACLTIPENRCTSFTLPLQDA